MLFKSFFHNNFPFLIKSIILGHKHNYWLIDSLRYTHRLPGCPPHRTFMTGRLTQESLPFWDPAGEASWCPQLSSSPSSSCHPTFPPQWSYCHWNLVSGSLLFPSVCPELYCMNSGWRFSCGSYDNGGTLKLWLRSSPSAYIPSRFLLSAHPKGIMNFCPYTMHLKDAVQFPCSDYQAEKFLLF